MQEKIELSATRASGDHLEVQISATAGVRRYLRESVFWCEYPGAEALADIPQSILAIPAAGSMITLAWALGAELRVPALDARFTHALHDVSAAIASSYPALPVEASTLSVQTIVESPPSEREPSNHGLLFSGGVDSTASLIALQDEVTDLFSVWGADVTLRNREFWEGQFVPLMRETVARTGTRTHVVRSNLRQLLDQARLDQRFAAALPFGQWWGGLQHGLSLLTVTTPLTYTLGCRRLSISSSNSEDMQVAWGSMPSIDNRVSWAGTRVSHERLGRTRQQKLREVVAPYVADGGTARLSVCLSSVRSDDRLNCGRCGKCLKTQAAILVAGMDPRQLGFETPDDFGGRLVTEFDRQMIRFSDNEVFIWSDIKTGLDGQSEVMADRYGAGTLFDWLRRFDPRGYMLETAADSGASGSGLRVAARSVYRRLPLALQRRLYGRIGPRW